jgi:hypothetical protein
MVYATQMLHALIALLTMFIMYRLAACLTNALGGLFASALLIGTPWVIVTGSLAYNEMCVALMLITGLLVIFSDDLDAHHEAALLGVLLGVACGAKLTSIGMVALPLMMLVLWKHSPKRWPLLIAIIGLIGTTVLAPYLLMNWFQTGNPVFPFLTGLFGTGHWTAEQAAIWASGHRVEGGIGSRLAEVTNQFLRYGIGANPYVDEPWKPHWSILPGLGGLAAMYGLSQPTLRKTTLKLLLLMLLQLVFWMLFTHVKSRFLLPMVIPLALCLAIALASIEEQAPRKLSVRAFKPILFVALLLWCSFPMVLFSSERNRQPGAMIDMAELMTGRSLIDPAPIRESSQQFDTVYLNHQLDADAKVLLVGNATPLYFDRPVVYQTTWDRGPLSRIMREAGENPAVWFRSLRDEGFTHLLVQPDMLRNWENAGWNDPLITADRVLEAAEQNTLVQARFPGDRVLYRLESPRNP